MATIRCGTTTFEGIEAIVFDKDGTLCDGADYLRNLAQRRARRLDAKVPGIADALLYAFGLERNRLDPNGLMNVGSRRENEVAAAAFVAEKGLPWRQALRLAEESFQEAEEQFSRLEYMPIFDDVLPLLQRLQQSGLKLGVLSSDTTANVQAFVAHHGLNSYFLDAQGADSLKGKPDPFSLIAVCEKLSVSVGKTLMVGDSPADIEVARRACAGGVIAVTRGISPASDLAEADCILADLETIQV